MTGLVPLGGAEAITVGTPGFGVPIGVTVGVGTASVVVGDFLLVCGIEVLLSPVVGVSLGDVATGVVVVVVLMLPDAVEVVVGAGVGVDDVSVAKVGVVVVLEEDSVGDVSLSVSEVLDVVKGDVVTTRAEEEVTGVDPGLVTPEVVVPFVGITASVPVELAFLVVSGPVAEELAGLVGLVVGLVEADEAVPVGEEV